MLYKIKDVKVFVFWVVRELMFIMKHCLGWSWSTGYHFKIKQIIIFKQGWQTIHGVPTVCAQLLSHVWVFVTPWTVTLCPWDSPGKNTGVDCHFLLQVIFLIQVSNPQFLSLLHQQGDSLPLVLPGKPPVGINKTVLEHGCAHLITYYAWLCSCGLQWQNRMAVIEILCSMTPKMLTIWPFVKSLLISDFKRLPKKV